MRKLLIPVTAVIIGITACNKHNNDSPSEKYTLSSALAGLAPTGKTVTINAETGGSFYGNSGSRYVFPANAFVTSSGAPVTGNVQVFAVEYLKQSDMLFSGVCPVSNGAPLISGGEMYVHATQNGEELSIAPGKTYQVNMPQGDTPVTGMKLFVGRQEQSTNAINWEQSNDSSTGIIYNGDTTIIISNKMNYCNADQFMSSPNYQNFTVTVSAGSAVVSDSLTAYALYDDYNGVWPMYAENRTFPEHHVPDIPVHFVVIGIINGDFYGGILGATPSTGTIYNVVLNKTTPTAFKALVAAL